MKMISFALAISMSLAAADLDQDGLDDSFESQLLEKFQPHFQIPVSDCDVAPAEFQPGEERPRVKARNGTIYGQVFRWNGANRPAAANLEIHYYHLWGHDCGHFSHPLDAEHVSALVSADSWTAPAGAWRASYWYAGAHETTFCNASTAVKAASIGAVERGAKVWVSWGKHASFLRESACHGGCGGDVCVQSRLLQAPKIVNIGERDRLINGAVWVRSWRWRLSTKMDSDFSDELVARLSGGEFVGPDETAKARSGVARNKPSAPGRWTAATTGALYVAARRVASVVKTP